MNEYTKYAVFAVIGGLLAWGVTVLTDTIDAGSDARVEAVAKRVFHEMNTTDSGQSVKAELSLVKGAVQANGGKLDILIDSVKALSE